MEQVAIVDARLRIPGATSLEAFWDNVVARRSSIAPVSRDQALAAGVSEAELSLPNYVPVAGTLDGIEAFDHAFFGYTFREAQHIDPQQRLLLTLAHQALEAAGHDTSSVGVFASIGFASYLVKNLAPGVDPRTGSTDMVLGNSPDCAATRIAYKLDLSGPAMTIQSGCSSALVAVHMARLAILMNQCDMALVGAASLQIPQRAGYLYARDGAVSADGVCRPFDAAATGTVFASGAAVIVLKKLSKALEDGNRVLGVIVGSAINNDGRRKAGFTAPSVKGQSDAIRRAYGRAKIDPRTIGYLEAHGTGTILGDPIEVQALSDAFASFTPDRQFCSLGSVKANVGHLDVAAGLIGLLKVSLCLQHRTRPPVANFGAPNPRLELAASPFYVQTEASAWEAPGQEPRRAAVSSLGVGGTNAHVIVQEPPAPAPSALSANAGLVLVSATSEQAAGRIEDALLAAARAGTASLGDLAYTSQLFRPPHAIRRALHVVRAPGGDVTSTVLRPTGDWRRRRFAFLFPGQGTQYRAMGAELHGHFAAFRAWFDRCAERFAAHGVVDLRRMLVDDQLDATDTANLQPYLFALEYALAKLLVELGLAPEILLGHSLGEYVAATLAEVFSLEDAVKIVAARGRLMGQAPRGAMLAVLRDEQAIAPWLDASFSLCAVNDPRSCVVGGAAAEIERLAGELGAAGIGTVRLRTSHAFHSHMMDPVLAAFRAEFTGVHLHRPTARIISNLDGRVDDARLTSPEYWVEHLRRPVRFLDGLRTLAAASPDATLVEVGPGRSIQNMVASSLVPPPEVFGTLAPGREVETTCALLGQCWANGLEISWAALYQHGRGRIVPLPPHPLDERTCWIDPPAAKLAPAVHHKQADIERWLSEPRWVPRPDDHDDVEASGERVLILSGPTALADALRDRLHRLGADAVSLDLRDVVQGRPTSSEAIAERVEERLARAPTARKIVSLLAIADGGGEPAIDDVVDAILVALGVCRALRRPADGPLELILVGAQGCRTTDEQVAWSQAWLEGFATVASQELPNLSVRCVDVAQDIAREAPTGSIAVLAAECLAGTDKLVAIRGRTRWVRELRPVDPGPARTRQARVGNVLLVGGAGHVGLVHAHHFLATVGANVAIVSRTASAIGARLGAGDTTGERIWDQRRRLLDTARAAKREVVFVDADAAAFDELRAAAAEAAARLGPLDAIVHVAGAPARIHYRPLLETDRDHLTDLIRPKLVVARNIDRLAREHRVARVFVVSSISAVLGGLGLAGYAMSHGLLDAYARAATDRACRWTTVDWDAWDFYKSEREAGARDVGIDALAITEDEGLAVLDRLGRRGWPEHVVVASGDLRERYERWVLRPSHPAPAPAGARAPRPQLSEDLVEPRTAIETQLAPLWADAIGLAAVGVRDNFFELGGHSLLAVSLVEQTNRLLGCDLSVVDLFKYPTIEKLASRIDLPRADIAPRLPAPSDPRGQQRRDYYRRMKDRTGTR